MVRRRCALACLLLLTLSLIATHGLARDRAGAARERVLPELTRELSAIDRKPGQPLHIRIYKQERRLELWLADASGSWRHYRDFEICAASGTLGPKRRQGDHQAPEGIYPVRRGQLNPASAFHLSFNLGYPNAFDRFHGRTGSALMVHGNCVSIGCYAMTDAGIERIYTLLAMALEGGQDAVPVHIFPFDFGKVPEESWSRHPEADFWRQLQAIHSAFGELGRPPEVRVEQGRYRVVRPVAAARQGSAGLQ